MEANAHNIHAKLISRCLDQDRAAQYEIYNLYSKAMFNTAKRIVGNENEAEDILQDAFVSAFKNLSSYRADASFGAWLKRIVINKALNQVKRIQKDLMLAESVMEEKTEVMQETSESTYSVEQIKICDELASFGF